MVRAEFQFRIRAAMNECPLIRSLRKEAQREPMKAVEVVKTKVGSL